MNKIHLMPGDLKVSKHPVLLSTILGSCVSVVLFDDASGVAGLNHYLLALVTAGETPTARYGEFALPKLLQELLQEGASKSMLRAKVYGGANVLPGVTLGRGIGTDNINIALEFLAAEKIPVIEKDVGGMECRKIVFNTDDFSVELVVGGSKSVGNSKSVTKPSFNE